MKIKLLLNKIYFLLKESGYKYTYYENAFFGFCMSPFIISIAIISILIDNETSSIIGYILYLLIFILYIIFKIYILKNSEIILLFKKTIDFSYNKKEIKIYGNLLYLFSTFLILISIFSFIAFVIHSSNFF